MNTSEARQKIIGWLGKEALLVIDQETLQAANIFGVVPVNVSLITHEGHMDIIAAEDGTVTSIILDEVGQHWLAHLIHDIVSHESRLGMMAAMFGINLDFADRLREMERQAAEEKARPKQGRTMGILGMLSSFADFGRWSGIADDIAQAEQVDKQRQSKAEAWRKRGQNAKDAHPALRKSKKRGR